jgi:hypothetical protein
MLMGIGFAVLSVGMLLLVVRRLAGGWVVDALTSNPDYKDASGQAWRLGTQLLGNVALNVIVYGLAFVLAAWISGPSRPATAIRRRLAPSLRRYPLVAYAVVTLALLVFLDMGPTDASRLVPLLILYGFVYLGLELFRRQTAREFPEAAA